jgi:hypothetical protein
MRAKAKIITKSSMELIYNGIGGRESRESRDKNESVYLPTDSKIL